MAKNIVINSVTYSGVPSVQVPISGGGGNATFYETSDATVTAATLASGDGIRTGRKSNRHANGGQRKPGQHDENRNDFIKAAIICHVQHKRS